MKLLTRLPALFLFVLVAFNVASGAERVAEDHPTIPVLVRAIDARTHAPFPGPAGSFSFVRDPRGSHNFAGPAYWTSPQGKSFEAKLDLWTDTVYEFDIGTHDSEWRGTVRLKTPGQVDGHPLVVEVPVSHAFRVAGTVAVSPRGAFDVAKEAAIRVDISRVGMKRGGDDYEQWRGVVDDSGQVDFWGPVDPGRYQILVSHWGLRNQIQVVTLPDDAAAVARLAITLELARNIAVQVVDEQQQPVPDLILRFASKRTDQEIQRVKAEELVTDRRVAAEMRASGMPAKPEKTIADIDVSPFDRGWSPVKTDGQGRGMLLERGDWAGAFSAPDDAIPNGEWRVSLQAGENERRGVELVGSGAVTITNATKELRLTVRSAARLELALTDPQGAPLGGVELRLERQGVSEDGRATIMNATTSADGTVSRSVASGGYVISSPDLVHVRPAVVTVSREEIKAVTVVGTRAEQPAPLVADPPTTPSFAPVAGTLTVGGAAASLSDGLWIVSIADPQPWTNPYGFWQVDSTDHSADRFGGPNPLFAQQLADLPVGRPMVMLVLTQGHPYRIGWTMPVQAATAADWATLSVDLPKPVTLPLRFDSLKADVARAMGGWTASSLMLIDLKTGQLVSELAKSYLEDEESSSPPAWPATGDEAVEATLIIPPGDYALVWVTMSKVEIARLMTINQPPQAGDIALTGVPQGFLVAEIHASGAGSADSAMTVSMPMPNPDQREPIPDICARLLNEGKQKP